MPPKQSKPVETTSNASTPVDKSRKAGSSKEMDHLLATIYFLDWSKNILERYGKDINKLFLIPLTEHCVLKKVMSATTTTDDHDQPGRVIETGRKLEEGVKVDDSNDELKQLQRRLLQSKQEVVNASEEYVPVLKEKGISLAESSAMYRLRTLVQMSGSLLIFMERIRAWIEKHRKVFSQYGRECNNVLQYAVRCFEGICVQADIFSLVPIDRSKVRSDCSKFIVAKDPYVGKQERKREQPLQFTEDPETLKQEVKQLEAQINFYRSSVHLIGSSLIDIVQAILKQIPRDILEVTTKEVRTIMERLPPGYHFPGDFRVTSSAGQLLSKPPANKRELSEIKAFKYDSLRTASNIDSSMDIQSASIGARSTQSARSESVHKSKSSKKSQSHKQKEKSSKKSQKEKPLASDKTQSVRSEKPSVKEKTGTVTENVDQ